MLLVTQKINQHSQKKLPIIDTKFLLLSNSAAETSPAIKGEWKCQIPHKPTSIQTIQITIITIEFYRSHTYRSAQWPTTVPFSSTWTFSMTWQWRLRRKWTWQPISILCSKTNWDTSLADCSEQVLVVIWHWWLHLRFSATWLLAYSVCMVNTWQGNSTDSET